jgi:hypothetical protein
MSKINDNIIEKYSKQIDNYFEHSQHIIYDINCSECFKEPPQVELSKDGYIRLVSNELRPPLTREDEEQLTLDKRMEEAESRARDEDNY